MKKICFILSLAIIALFAACSEDLSNSEVLSKNVKQQNLVVEKYKPTYKYAFACKMPEGNTKAFMAMPGKWEQFSEINIKFYNGTEEMQNKIKEIAEEWQQYINVRFKFVPTSTPDRKCDIRISFYNKDDPKYNKDRMSWSEIGTRALLKKRGATANVNMFIYNDPVELNSIDFKAQVLRIFGHILGLINEHQTEMNNIILDEDETYAYFGAYGWDEDQIYKNIIDIIGIRATLGGVYDSTSIMLMYIPDYLILRDPDGDKNKPLPSFEFINTELSENDITFIKSMYPKTEASPYEKGEIGSMFLYFPTGDLYDGNDDPNLRKGTIGLAYWDWDKRSYTAQGQVRTYPTIGVGEYNWTTQNTHILYRQQWGISANIFNITDSEIQRIAGAKGFSTPSVDDFIEIFGTWTTDYGELTGCVRNDFTVYDQRGGNVEKGWDYPDLTAILQMFGQMPVKYADIKSNIFDFMMANIYIDNIKNVGVPFMRQWSSTSGLCITPLGLSTNEAAEIRSSYYDYGIGFGLKMKNVPRGLFVNDRNTKVAVNHSLYHFCSSRYCRPYTDKELGYKMFYSDTDDVVIYKPYGGTNPGDDYKELPRGLERGIALRYTYRAPGKEYTKYRVVERWSIIKAEATKIISQLDINYY